MRVLSQRYELLDVVGRGVNGQVWRARDLGSSRVVAVKTLVGEVSRRVECREVFLREAQGVAALAHPGIVAPLDYGFDRDALDPVAFLVTEFVEGSSLAALGQTGPLPVRQAVAIVRAVADALAYAHRVGVLHGGVRPANVLLTASDGAKVLDFGVSRMVTDPVTGERPVADDAELTVEMLRYMAPEQVSSRPLDARADQNALGLLLFELLSGRPAFEGGGFKVIMAKKRAVRVPSRLRASMPPELVEALQRTTAAEPEYRFPSMDDVVAALDTIVGSAAGPSGAWEPFPPQGSAPPAARRSWWSRNRQR